jgi:acetyl esterase/lipase
MGDSASGGKTAREDMIAVMPSHQFETLAQMMKAGRSEIVPSIPELRTGFEALTQAVPPPSPDVEVTSSVVGTIPVDRITAPGADTDRVLLYLHGGGYCIGSRATYRHIAARLSAEAGMVVLLPEYRLAPEHPFPAAVDDALLVYRRLISGGTPADRIAVAGDSAGGGLALALQVASRDAGDPVPAASALLSAWADLSDLGPVSDEALDIDFLRPETLEFFAQNYLGDGDRTVVTASPALADLAGLGSMLVQAGECEILLDTSRRVAARAKDAGVDVTLEVEPAMFHAWHLFAGWVPESDEALARVGSFLRDRLS